VGFDYLGCFYQALGKIVDTAIEIVSRDTRAKARQFALAAMEIDAGIYHSRKRARDVGLKAVIASKHLCELDWCIGCIAKYFSCDPRIRTRDQYQAAEHGPLEIKVWDICHRHLLSVFFR